MVYFLASLHFGKDIVFKFNTIIFFSNIEFLFVIITYLIYKYFNNI